MAQEVSHGKIIAVLVGVAVVGALALWLGPGALALLALVVPGASQIKPPDLATVEKKARQDVLATPSADVVASLDPSTRSGIADIKAGVSAPVDAIVDDALAEARRLSDAHADGVGIHEAGQVSGGEGPSGSPGSN